MVCVKFFFVFVGVFVVYFYCVGLWFVVMCDW